jgi:hypothetical protein
LSGLRFSASLKPLAAPDLERIPREASPKAFSDGEGFILYAILDFIVDNYMPVFPSGKLPRSARPPRRAGLLVSDAGAARGSIMSSAPEAPAGAVREGLSTACLDARMGPSVETGGRRLKSTTLLKGLA